MSRGEPVGLVAEKVDHSVSVFRVYGFGKKSGMTPLTTYMFTNIPLMLMASRKLWMLFSNEVRCLLDKYYAQKASSEA
jgi:hypothetical protein